MEMEVHCIVKGNCPYKQHGCYRVLKPNELEDHRTCCLHRPYRCLFSFVSPKPSPPTSIRSEILRGCPLPVITRSASCHFDQSVDPDFAFMGLGEDTDSADEAMTVPTSPQGNFGDIKTYATFYEFINSVRKEEKMAKKMEEAVGSSCNRSQKTVGSSHQSQDTSGRATDLKQETFGSSSDLPQETLVGSSDLPGETFVGSSDLPEEKFVGSSDLPEEAFVGSSDLPQETFVGSSDIPQETFVGSSNPPQDTFVGPSDPPRETLVGPSDLPQETFVGSSDLPQETFLGSSDLPHETFGSSSNLPQDRFRSSSDQPQKMFESSFVLPQKTLGTSSDLPQEKSESSGDLSEAELESLSNQSEEENENQLQSTDTKSDSCSWEGSLTHLIQHLEEEHAVPEFVLQPNVYSLFYINIDALQDSKRMILNCFESYFLFIVRMDVLNFLYMDVQLMGPRYDLQKYRYSIAMKTRDGKQRLIENGTVKNWAGNSEEAFKNFDCVAFFKEYIDQCIVKEKLPVMIKLREIEGEFQHKRSRNHPLAWFYQATI